MILYHLAYTYLLIRRSTKEEANVEEGYKDRQRDLIIYAVLTFSLLVLGLARGFVFFNTFLKSSQNIYLKMFSGIMRAPMYFFDTNSIGRSICYAVLIYIRNMEERHFVKMAFLFTIVTSKS